LISAALVSNFDLKRPVRRRAFDVSGHNNRRSEYLDITEKLILVPDSGRDPIVLYALARNLEMMTVKIVLANGIEAHIYRFTIMSCINGERGCVITTA